MKRIVTAEQLKRGVVIRWPDGREKVAGYVVTNTNETDGTFEVKEPVIDEGGFVSDVWNRSYDDRANLFEDLRE